MTIVAAGCVVACAPVLTGTSALPGTADTPGRMWLPPKDLPLPDVKPLATEPELPEGVTVETLQQGVTLSLPQVLDIALRNNPATRVPWAQARQAAAQLGVAQSGWFPQLAIGVDLQHQKLAALGGRFDIEYSQVAAALSLSWLLFDFGGRQGRVDEAAGALIAANFEHDRAIQDLVLQVEQAYVQLVNAKALLEAQDTILKAAQASYDSARAREEAGVGTRADVLQAQTALSQAKLEQTRLGGQIDSLQGALAASMGLPATLRVKVTLERPALPSREVTQAIEPLVQNALTARPDLAAARARIAQAQGAVRQARGARLPALVATGNWNPTYFFLSSGNSVALRNFNLGLSLDFPLFDGFSTAYAESAAREAESAAQAQADALASQVVLEVWQAYVGLGTAAAAVDNAADLLASARENFDVAQGRYREGVGSIIDLLAAQQALGTAQSSIVQARSAWYLAFSQLAYATGGLLPTGSVLQPTGRAPPTTTPETKP